MSISRDKSRARALGSLILAGLLAAACEPGVVQGSPLDSGTDDAGSDRDNDDSDDDEEPTDAGKKPKPDASTSQPRDDGGTADDDAGAGGSDDPFEALRQSCLDTINGYRATLKRAPLKRAPASEESCSDVGAKYDHDRKKAHGSAAELTLPCRAYGVVQNTCPDYPFGGSAGDQEAAMKRCFKQMWAEGEPPGGIAKCVDDYFNEKPACFLAHGHYINMQSPDSKTVSCGFYATSKVIWMNQDFR